jgi:hypothetical protein
MRGRLADIRFGGLDHAGRTDYLTPPDLKRRIYGKWDLNFDPCPYPRPEWDGLEVPWEGRAFVNPPYGGGGGGVAPEGYRGDRGREV